MRRRNLLAAVVGGTAVGLAGCNSVIGSGDPTPTDSEKRAHTVSVYLGDRELSREATVTINNENGTTLFENEYSLSNTNEADEDATFPASNNPNTIVVTIDGTRFERDWPGFEHPELPCEDPNHAGIEIWVEQTEDGSPAIRLGVNCQSVMVDGQPT